MNYPLKTISLFATATCLTFSSLTAVETDPVGYVTFTVNANSDQRLGVPMQRPAVLQATTSNVIGVTVEAPGIGALTGEHFLIVTSGNAQGEWEQVDTATEGEVTLTAEIPGFSAADQFAIRPFWTLSGLFPDGGAIPASSNPLSPDALVLLNDPNSVGTNLAASDFYFYNDGTQGDPGWFNSSSFDPAGDVIISPEVSLTIRNNTSSEASIVIAGDVPLVPNAINVVSREGGRQDNLIFNPLPVGVTLGNSDLISSGAFEPSSNPLSPSDLLLLFDPNNSGKNASPQNFYFYNDGTQGDAGWFDASSFDPADSIEVSQGGAFIVRKASGTDSQSSWSPPALSL